MTTYQQTIQNYGPEGLIDEEVIEFELTGEAEQAHLSPDRLRNAYQTLRQWSVDAQANYDTWPTKTNAQKDAAQRETIRRLGILMDRLADLLLLEGRS
jgi:hypothetical protein